MSRLGTRATPGAVMVRFPWSYYADGRPTRGNTAGRPVSIRMRMGFARSAKWCTACGSPITAGTEHRVPDYAGSDSYSIDVGCPRATVTPFEDVTP